MVCGHDLGAPPEGLGRVAYRLIPGNIHENPMVASTYLQRTSGRGKIHTGVTLAGAMNKPCCTALLTCGQLMLVSAHLGSPNCRSVVTPWRPMKAGSEKPQRQTWGFSTSIALPLPERCHERSGCALSSDRVRVTSDVPVLPCHPRCS